MNELTKRGYLCRGSTDQTRRLIRGTIHEMAYGELFGIAGMVTGSVGAVTGVAGLILAYRVYRRDSKQSASQMQLQVLKGQKELSVRCDAVEALIRKAKQSRANAQGAVGSSLSGAVQQFVAEADGDLVEVESVRLNVMDLKVMGNQPADLDAVLVRSLAEAHGARIRLEHLDKKYEGALAEDDRTREHIRRTMEQLWRNPGG